MVNSATSSARREQKNFRVHHNNMGNLSIHFALREQKISARREHRGIENRRTHLIFHLSKPPSAPCLTPFPESVNHYRREIFENDFTIYLVSLTTRIHPKIEFTITLWLFLLTLKFIFTVRRSQKNLFKPPRFREDTSPQPSCRQNTSRTMSSQHPSLSPPPSSLPTSRKSKPLPSFAQLVNDKFDRHIHVHPRDLNRIQSVRKLREEGVLDIMDAIRDCGWACSTLYASDRGDGEQPVLVDGSHRLEALRRLSKSKDTSWLLSKETPQNFKITLTVLKGLTLEEEGLVGREADHINSHHVSMTLVDHIIATHKAVIATRVRLNLNSGQELTSETLRKVHPDFKRYANSTIRAWKGMAEGLSPQARKLLLQVHASGLNSGEVKTALSKKTLLESKMMRHLRNYPGAQFWYLKRLVELEADAKIRKNKASYFEDLVLVLKNFSEPCTSFVGHLKHTFKLSKVAKYIDQIVQTGMPCERLAPSLKKHLTTFACNYLWTSKMQKEVQALLELRKKDTRMYPYVFYQLVAQLHFKENYEEVDKTFAAPEANLRVRFTSPVDPTQANLDYLQLLQNRRQNLQKRRREPPSSGQSSMQKSGPSRKKQKSAASKSKGKEKREHQEVEGEDKDEATSEVEDEVEDEADEEAQDDKEKTLQCTPAAKETKEKTKASPGVLSKTSVSLEIYHTQSSTLASTLLHDIKKLLEKVKVPPGERVTLKIQQNGKLATERAFN